MIQHLKQMIENNFIRDVVKKGSRKMALAVGNKEEVNERQILNGRSDSSVSKGCFTVCVRDPEWSIYFLNGKHKNIRNMIVKELTHGNFEQWRWSPRQERERGHTRWAARYSSEDGWMSVGRNEGVCAQASRGWLSVRHDVADYLHKRLFHLMR